jgi:4-hydroxybenzoate polyprenyltransferase
MFNDVIDRDLDFKSDKYWKFTYNRPDHVTILKKMCAALTAMAGLMAAMIGYFQLIIFIVSIVMVVLYSCIFKRTRVFDLVSNFLLGLAPLLMVGYIGPILLVFGFTSLTVFINGGIVDRKLDAENYVSNTFTTTSDEMMGRLQSVVTILVFISCLLSVMPLVKFNLLSDISHICLAYLALVAILTVGLSNVNKSVVSNPLKIRWMELYAVIGMVRLMTLFPIGFLHFQV